MIWLMIMNVNVIAYSVYFDPPIIRMLFIAQGNLDFGLFTVEKFKRD